MAEILTWLLVVNGWLLGLLVGWTFYKGFRALSNNRKDEVDFMLWYRFTEIFLWPWGIVQLMLTIFIYWFGWST